MPRANRCAQLQISLVARAAEIEYGDEHTLDVFYFLTFCHLMFFFLKPTSIDVAVMEIADAAIDV